MRRDAGVPVRSQLAPFLVGAGWSKPARRARIQGRDRAGEGHLHAELGVSPAEAFRLLSRYSQNNNQRVRKISAGLVQGLIAAAEFRPPADPEQA